MSEQNIPKLIEDLRAYQAELLAQNSVLQFSRIAAESASERFESLFSNVPLALMVVDSEGMIVQSNAMALQQFRPTEADPPLNFLLPLVKPGQVARVEKAFAIAKSEGQCDLNEVAFSRGLRDSFTGDLHIARIQYSQDDQPHYICAVIDQGPLLTERRALNERRRALQESSAALQQRNEELRQSENRLAAIINSSMDAIICVDREQNISVFNPAAAKLFNCPPERALHTSLRRFLPKAIDAIAATQVGTHAVLGEVNGLTADGVTLALEVSASCERHPEGNITTVFAHDLTSRKQDEEHRNMLESQLRESHKMQAIGTMAGGIAHDFNNILSAILGNVALAKQDVGPDSPAQISLVEIEKAGRRARDLVRQILTFSRNESPQRSTTQLADVAQETARLLRVTLPPTTELQLHLKETPPVLADTTQVEQALINLCTNAIHALGQNKGTVSIELDTVSPDALECERLRLPMGDYVTLSVRDSGSGMSADTLARVFEPFFTTKPVGQGTGLGLAVVHGVMRTHQGTVDVSSELGQGSLFTLYFPSAGDTIAEPLAAPPRSSTFMGLGKHVMFVDDDEALVFLMVRALDRRGFKVTAFTDPRKALAELRERSGDYDLLVTDYNMPGFSGVDLLKEVQQLMPWLPVALASGYVTPEIEQSALAAGARALIYKPNDVSEFCDTVRRLLQDDAL
jgi:two-component system cell cycle sensor histidine kinase/response regulator CckA